MFAGQDPLQPVGNEKLFMETLERGLEFWGIRPVKGFLHQCRKYYALLDEWNRVFRLVGHRNPEDVALNLFLDSGT